MESLTLIFLIFLFLAIFFFSFFVVLLANNYSKIFYYPKPRKKYKISFLVPAHNEQDSIEEAVRAIFNSKYPIEEVIVINDGSKDNTAGIVKKLQKNYSKLKLLNKKNSGKADSLNKGIAIAKGELIAVVDADSYPEPEAVERMVGFFDDKEVGAVTSCVFLKNRDTFFERLQEIEYIILAWTRKLLDFVDSVYVTNGPLSIYRKSVLKEAGGFDVNSITEDIELTWHILSLGYKTRMSLASRVYTTVPSKFKRWWRQRVRWGQGGLETIAKYRKDFLRKGKFGLVVIPFVSFTFLMSIVSFIFGLYLVYRQIAIGALYTSYSASMQSTIFRVEALNSSPTVMLIMVAILFIISFGYSSWMFNIMGQEHITKKERILNRLFYMLVYLTLYPVVLFESIYRAIRREHKW